MNLFQDNVYSIDSSSSFAPIDSVKTDKGEKSTTKSKNTFLDQ